MWTLSQKYHIAVAKIVFLSAKFTCMWNFPHQFLRQCSTNLAMEVPVATFIVVGCVSYLTVCKAGVSRGDGAGPGGILDCLLCRALVVPVKTFQQRGRRQTMLTV